METVPLADQPCHCAGISINDFGGGVYLSRWPPSVTTVVQLLPNENHPVVLPPPCQAPVTSTGETGQPLLSQRVPSAFLPCVHGHPIVLPQLLLPAPRKKKVSSRCRHFTSVVLHFVASIFALNLLPLLASALLRYRKARLPRATALKSTNRGPYTATLAPSCPQKSSRLRGGGRHTDWSPTEKKRQSACCYQKAATSAWRLSSQDHEVVNRQ
ncbi:uncharacterized protein LOC142589995 [Dermacentor variabilis]|uniref:uncharacterized protein LOC142589995 n=1 Tax=Dermacentor variabilis TaxID=34621 RepID=UPI003F5B4A2B